jgi:hypothetical protein
MPATATIEQPSPTPLNDDVSSVHYDTDGSEISVTVIVSLFDGNTIVTVAPLTVPKGTWTVLWNLVAGPGISSVRFPQTDGIFVPPDQQPPIPRNVTLSGSQRNSDTQWQLQVENTVTTINSFNYDITVEPLDTSAVSLGPTVVHDPTIAVTQDPMT